MTINFSKNALLSLSELVSPMVPPIADILSTNLAALSLRGMREFADWRYYLLDPVKGPDYDRDLLRPHKPEI